MPQITGIQQREPYSHSAASYSDYDHRVDADEFSIKRYKDNRIRVFFKRTALHGQGVGLLLPSAEAGIALGRALIMVSEGYSTDITSSI